MTFVVGRRIGIAFDVVVGLLLDNPGDAVYGAIAVGALLAAESARRETYVRTVTAVVITLLLYWLAHSYADLAGQRLRAGDRLSARRFISTMVHEFPILLGAILPLITILLCWSGGVSLSGAVTAAVWTSASIVLLIELVAAIRAQLRGLPLLVQALTGAGLGSLIIVLRGLLH